MYKPTFIQPIVTHCRQKNPAPSLLQDQKGAATLEVVIIIAVLLAIALIFNTQLRDFAGKIFKKVFDDKNVIDRIGVIG